MTEHFCCFINYSKGEVTCEKVARFQHGYVWLCAEHFDFVTDYSSGTADPEIVWGCDLSLNQEPVFVVLYK